MGELKSDNHLGIGNKGIVVDKGRPDCKVFENLIWQENKLYRLLIDKCFFFPGAKIYVSFLRYLSLCILHES